MRKERGPRSHPRPRPLPLPEFPIPDQLPDQIPQEDMNNPAPAPPKWDPAPTRTPAPAPAPAPVVESDPVADTPVPLPLPGPATLPISLLGSTGGGTFAQPGTEGALPFRTPNFGINRYVGPELIRGPGVPIRGKGRRRRPWEEF